MCTAFTAELEPGRVFVLAPVRPDKRHWTGAGAVLPALHQIDAKIVDPFSPLPSHPRGMWHKKYERLARCKDSPRAIYAFACEGGE
jgi:hypothetical protein